MSAATSPIPARRSRPIRLGVLIAVLIAAAIALSHHAMILNGLGRNAHALGRLAARHPVLAFSSYFLAYIAATAVSFPGAIILTLGAGALFGLVAGSVLVSFAASIGASLAFLTARFVLRDAAIARFPTLFTRIDRGIARDGAWYLVSLRLIPAIPFVAINLLAGLTRLDLRKFYLASQIGMLPATIIYVNAGATLTTIGGAHGAILTPRLIVALLLLASLSVLAPVLRNRLAGRRHAGFIRPRRFDRNLVVIGAGSAGLVAAYLASTLRAKVTLIEQTAMGGDCLNTGCVPSKALLHAACAGLDFDAARAAVRAAIVSIAPHDSVARYQGLGVDVRQGHATIETPWSVAIDGEIITTRAIVIAAGAAPTMPPIPGLTECPHATSETLWDLDALPARLIILGGGPIGCEMAQAFARLGSAVTIVEAADRLLMREDDEVSAAMQAVLRRDGVTVLTGHAAVDIATTNAGSVLRTDHRDQPVTLGFDRILVAVGRTPRVAGYGLDKLGIDVTESGTIENDAFLQTAFPNIVVCGDVAGPYQFTHIAGFQGGFAALNALFAPFWRFKPTYRAVPAVTYTRPEFARVGITRREASDRNIACEVTRVAFADIDRSLAEADTEGFVSVLTKPGSDRILGATIVGTGAGELLTGFTIAMQHGLGLKKLMDVIYPYPTRSEAIRAVAGQWRQRRASPRGLAILARFHTWRRGSGRLG